MRLAPLVLVLLVLSFLPLANADLNQPTSGQQLFFDDFTQSQFPTQWTALTPVQLNNSTEVNGYLVSTVQRNAAVNTLGYSIDMDANNTSPIVQSTTTAGFVQVVFKMQPFNQTSLSTITPANSSIQVVEDIQFGLQSSIGAGFFSNVQNGLYFELMESGQSLHNAASDLTPAKTAVYLSTGCPLMAYPCSLNHHMFFPSLLSTGQDQPAMLYSDSMDLNSVHIFTIQLNINFTDPSKEYARFQVDSNGWMVYEQNGCDCLGTGAGGVSNLFPFFGLTYRVMSSNKPFVLSGSLASQIDYVGAWNYAPTTLPAGQLLSSNINPPLQNLGIYQPGGFSLTQYIQFQANEIGQGNIYAGGLFLTGIFMLIITFSLAGVFWKLHLGMSLFGMIWNISTLAFIFLMFYSGVIPLLVPVLVAIGAAAIFFGIFRSGPPGQGGPVPD